MTDAWKRVDDYLAEFWSTVFKRVRFENCNLSETNFQSADLAGVVLYAAALRIAKQRNLLRGKPIAAVHHFIGTHGCSRD